MNLHEWMLDQKPGSRIIIVIGEHESPPTLTMPQTLGAYTIAVVRESTIAADQSSLHAVGASVWVSRHVSRETVRLYLVPNATIQPLVEQGKMRDTLGLEIKDLP